MTGTIKVRPEELEVFGEGLLSIVIGVFFRLENFTIRRIATEFGRSSFEV